VLSDLASLSTAGRWVNDYLDGRASTTAKALHGGKITLASSYDIDLRSGSLLDVSGGGRIDVNGKLEAGNAGSIALATGLTIDKKKGTEKGAFDFTEDGDRRDASLFLDGTLAGYALGNGGKLEINTSKNLFTNKTSEQSRNLQQLSRDWNSSTRLTVEDFLSIANIVGKAATPSALSSTELKAIAVFLERVNTQLGKLKTTLPEIVNLLRSEGIPTSWSDANVQAVSDILALAKDKPADWTWSNTDLQAVANHVGKSDYTYQVGAAFTADFLNRGGFYNFSFVGRDGVTVSDGVRLAPTPTNWSLTGVPSYRYKATGSALGSFATTAVLHPDLRNAPTKLSLATRSLTYGDLIVGNNAYLGVSPQGSINLESWGQLTLLGTLEAPAGTITLSRPADREGEPYNLASITYSEAKQSESIFLGADSRILAGGAVVLDDAARAALEAGISADTLRAQNRYKGVVLDGGAVSIDAGLGYLVSAKGSLIDVSGTQAQLNTATATGNGGLGYPVRTVGSAGGRVGLAAREGMLLDGSYAAAGQNGAPGGVFSLRLYELATNATWDSLGLPASMSRARQLTLFQSTVALPHPLQWTFDAVQTASYLAGDTTLPSADFNGKAALDIAPLVSAGFGSWYLSSRDEMRFDGTLKATVSNQLRLDAPKFSATSDATRVTFAAAALQLGNVLPAPTFRRD
jgi:hypothetical protein